MVVVVLKPLGPVQLYDVNAPVPVTAPAVNVSEVPTHKFVVDGVILATVGAAFIVTAALPSKPQHPLPLAARK